MEINIRINDVEKTVKLSPSGDTYVAIVDGREYTVSAATLSHDMLAFFVANRSHTAYVSCGPKGMHMSLDGRDYLVADASPDAETPGASGLHGGDGRLTAPMPGNIVAVHADAGDDVTAGQPIIVLESMKMQNEIVAPVAGKVTRVGCKVGDQVGFNDVLAEIAAHPTET